MRQRCQEPCSGRPGFESELSPYVHINKLIHLSAPWFPHQGVANPILQSVRLGRCFWVAHRMQERDNTDFLCLHQAINGNSLPRSDWCYDKPNVFGGLLHGGQFSLGNAPCLPDYL